MRQLWCLNSCCEGHFASHLFTFYANAVQGALIANSALSHDSEVTALAWQPSGRVIAVGWADGTHEELVMSMHFLMNTTTLSTYLDAMKMKE